MAIWKHWAEIFEAIWRYTEEFKSIWRYTKTFESIRRYTVIFGDIGGIQPKESLGNHSRILNFITLLQSFCSYTTHCRSHCRAHCRVSRNKTPRVDLCSQIKCFLAKKPFLWLVASYIKTDPPKEREREREREISRMSTERSVWLAIHN